MGRMAAALREEDANREDSARAYHKDAVLCEISNRLNVRVRLGQSIRLATTLGRVEI